MQIASKSLLIGSDWLGVKRIAAENILVSLVYFICYTRTKVCQ